MNPYYAMNMIKQPAKKTFATWYDYQLADNFVRRATRMLLYRWSPSFDKAPDKETHILSQIKQAVEYLKVTMKDDYLANMYLILIGCRSEGVPLSIALERMEKVRQNILDTMNKNREKGLDVPELTQYISEDSPVTKLKYLLRFCTTQHTVNLLYQKLKLERREKQKAELPERANFSGSPDMFIDKVNTFLQGYS
jgi:hypothetical protein